VCSYGKLHIYIQNNSDDSYYIQTDDGNRQMRIFLSGVSPSAKLRDVGILFFTTKDGVTFAYVVFADMIYIFFAIDWLTNKTYSSSQDDDIAFFRKEAELTFSKNCKFTDLANTRTLKQK
jgi:hypothetical protein